MSKRTIAACLFLLSAWAPGLFAGQELDAYRERVALHDDGSAAIDLALTVSAAGDGRLRIPLRRAPLPGLAVTGIAASAVQTEDRAGQLFLVLGLPANRRAPLAIGISFRVAAYVATGGEAVPFGGRGVDYRFVNTTCERIGAFSAVLELPTGFVFLTIDDYSPQPRKAGAAVPYAVGRERGKALATLSLADVRLGDDIALRGTFRRAAKSKWLLFSLLAVALLYLVFFRDMVSPGKKGGRAVP